VSLRWSSFSSVFLRYALGLAFLSAVADRFSRFLEYTHTINWYVPTGMIPALAIIATAAELVLGLLLLVGWYARVTALLTGLLLLVFGVAMALGLGIKAPLDCSVFSAAGGAFLLTNCERFPFSVDDLLFRRTQRIGAV
jgi:uncharacterized membrane protein YphA (DoxX/SURF4 family)